MSHLGGPGYGVGVGHVGSGGRQAAQQATSQMHEMPQMHEMAHSQHAFGGDMPSHMHRSFACSEARSSGMEKLFDADGLGALLGDEEGDFRDELLSSIPTGLLDEVLSCGARLHAGWARKAIPI